MFIYLFKCIIYIYIYNIYNIYIYIYIYIFTYYIYIYAFQPFTVLVICSDLEVWLVSEYATVSFNCYYWNIENNKNCLMLIVYKICKKNYI